MFFIGLEKRIVSRFVLINGRVLPGISVSICAFINNFEPSSDMNKVDHNSWKSEFADIFSTDNIETALTELHLRYDNNVIGNPEDLLQESIVISIYMRGVLSVHEARKLYSSLNDLYIKIRSKPHCFPMPGIVGLNFHATSDINIQQLHLLTNFFDETGAIETPLMVVKIPYENDPQAKLIFSNLARLKINSMRISTDHSDPSKFKASHFACIREMLIRNASLTVALSCQILDAENRTLFLQTFYNNPLFLRVSSDDFMNIVEENDPDNINAFVALYNDDIRRMMLFRSLNVAKICLTRLYDALDRTDLLAAYLHYYLRVFNDTPLLGIAIKMMYQHCGKVVSNLQNLRERQTYFLGTSEPMRYKIRKLEVRELLPLQAFRDVINMNSAMHSWKMHLKGQMQGKALLTVGATEEENQTSSCKSGHKLLCR